MTSDTPLLRALTERCRKLETENCDLLRELQIAINETCNAYHSAGHFARVKARWPQIKEPDE